MIPLLMALGAGIAFLVAYHTYGRWLGRKLFRLSATALCPSAEFEDGSDYVPTSRSVVFGHHFTSIAGTGPIVGPAIAIMWGWVPALIWVVLGSIFIGAVHDMGSLVVSLRNHGQTVGEIAGRLINPRVRLLFLFVLFLALTVVLAIFGLVIAAVFRQYPAAIFPCVIQIPVAVGIGLWLHRRGAGLFVPSALALATMYLTVIYGDVGWLHFINTAMAGWSNWTWVLLLLIYSYIASVLPVWTLLQPRDYINSLQLVSSLGLILAGLVAAALWGGAAPAAGARPVLEFAAPAFQAHPAGAPPLWPFLFITVACGAVSGFHCLVSSGTSSKQLQRETDARFVGFGSMLMEGFLAVLVILACAAGLGLGVDDGTGEVLHGTAAWAHRYQSWQAAGSLGAKVGAFVDGSANLLAAVGIGHAISLALMGVMVASFAGTTLDTTCRLQRYVVQELAGVIPGAGLFRNMHLAGIFAIVMAALLAAVPPTGQSWSLAHAGTGGLVLWPLFGATNQLLAGLAFLVIVFYLWRRNLPVWFIVVPAVFMLAMPAWAMFLQIFVGNSEAPSWVESGSWTLLSIGLATLALEGWMLVEAVILLPKVRGAIEVAGGRPGRKPAIYPTTEGI